jgi:hypothetical protein
MAGAIRDESRELPVEINGKLKIRSLGHHVEVSA